MKHKTLIEIAKYLKSKPRLLRQGMLIAFVGLVGLLILGGMAVWAAISVTRYATFHVSEAAKSPLALNQIANGKIEFEQLQRQSVKCWDHAQSFLAIQPWLEKPALDNLKQLKSACLEGEKPLDQAPQGPTT